MTAADRTSPRVTRVKVLFIAGWSRSGSTILSSLLGQLEGFLSIGEAITWDRNLLQNRLCACSAPLRDCPFWQEIAGDYLKMSPAKLEAIKKLRGGFRMRHFGMLLTPSGRRWIDRRTREYRRFLGGFYRHLRDRGHYRVLVDSSKFATHGHVLSLMDDIDLYVLHMVRDPRGVVHSWGKPKIYEVTGEGPRRMGRRGSIDSSLRWLAWNTTAELLWARRHGRYLRVRHEDFTRQPRETLLEIGEIMGETIDLGFFTTPTTARIEPSHIMGGNPARYRSGQVEIVKDERWKTEMPRSRQWLVTGLTLPLLLRYGYSRPAGESGPRSPGKK